MSSTRIKCGYRSTEKGSYWHWATTKAKTIFYLYSDLPRQLVPFMCNNEAIWERLLQWVIIFVVRCVGEREVVGFDYSKAEIIQFVCCYWSVSHGLDYSCYFASYWKLERQLFRCFRVRLYVLSIVRYVPLGPAARRCRPCACTVHVFEEFLA